MKFHSGHIINNYILKKRSMKMGVVSPFGD